MMDANYRQHLDAFMAEQGRAGRVVAYHPIYADMAGDPLAGLVLSQICYWHGPDKAGRVRLRVAKDGRLWGAWAAKHMGSELRMTPAQVNRCYNVLVKKGLVLKRVWRFAGTPTTHLSLNWPVFEALRAQYEDAVPVSFEPDDLEAGDDQLPGIESICPTDEIRLSPEPKSKSSSDEIITEITTKITTEKPALRAGVTVGSRPTSTKKPVDPVSEKKKPKRKARPSWHPSLRSYFTVVGRRPRKAQEPIIKDALGPKPDTELLRRCYNAWIAKDYRPSNISWITDWYVAGGPPDWVEKQIRPADQHTDPDYYKGAINDLDTVDLSRYD